MNNSLDWNLLRALLAVIDHGSVLAAARVLGYSQPTVSRQLADLASQLGLVLFERTGRGLHATQTALKLAQLARTMDAAAASVSTLARGAEQAESGSVRVSASQPMACHLLPPLLAKMRMLLPRIHVELVVTNGISNLLRREADIALRMVNPLQSEVIARRLGKVQIGAYAHHDYLQRRGIPQLPADLLGHDIIGGDTSTEVIDGLRKLGLPMQPKDFVLRTDDLVAAGQALRSGVGIGFIADYVARAEPGLLPVLPELKIQPLPLWLVVHREIRSNPQIRDTFNFLLREVPKAL